MNIVDQIALRASAECPALVAGDETITYGELFERVSNLSSWLVRCPGFDRQGTPRVGLAYPGGLNYIILALAILKAGGCLVPLADELTETERLELIERTSLSGLIVRSQESWQAAIQGTRDHTTDAAWIDLGEAKFQNESEFIALDPAFIRFSSGTTRKSKGVILSHAKLRERIVAANAAMEITSRDRILWMLPMAHHFAVSIILYLYHGACTVLGPTHLADEILATATKTRATVIYGAPFHYALLAATSSELGWPDLRLAVTTAAPLPIETARNFQKRFNKPLVQGLGIIEIGLPLLNTGSPSDAPTSVGRPLPAFDIELRDDDGRALPAGCIGELWIKGPGMLDAYLSPWQPVDEICVDGWFATGDLAETDAAGRVYLRGRKKSVLNVSGMKVFPEEIEATIEKHPAVKRCRVTGIPHAVLGTVPIAEVILHPDNSLTARTLSQWCRNTLSVYKVPVQVSFVDTLPLTASGKIRRI